MARGELIGMMNCPECGFAEAEVRPDKSGSPYRFCPDCTAQYFTRGQPEKVRNLMSKVRLSKPVEKEISEVSVKEISADSPVKAAPTAPASKPSTPPQPAKNSWLPLIGN